MKYLPIIVIIIALFLSGCAEKFDINQFNTDNPGNIAGDTLYVAVTPNWEPGLNNPQAMIIGNEPFLYVADTDNNRIIMMNLAGQVLGIREGIKKPIAIAQDYQLNLIICAEFDSTFTTGETKTYSAVYKMDMSSVGHTMETAPLRRLLPRSSSDLKEQIKYTGVAVFFDNSFYVSRTGPNNSSFIDPDNSILMFQKKITSTGSKIDTLIGRLPSLQPLGTGLLTAYNISSLTSFRRRNNDFILTLTGETSFKTQWLYFNFNSESPSYESRLNPPFADIMRVNKFIKPEGTTIDNAGNLFVADAGKDTVFKFNSFGDELQSFGGFGNIKLKSPHDVAFFDQTIYVLDTGNNRIIRFVLSTDLR
jgi:hypothetical protein